MAPVGGRKRARAAVLALSILLGLVGWPGLERNNYAYSQFKPEEIAARTDPPDSFDWSASGVVTPVRSQLHCAAGWAFAATAMLESSIALDTGRQANLSEQYLLNCGGPDYSCQQGGWGALDLYWSTFYPPQQEAGAVLESALPYRGESGVCKRAYPHPYRIDRWGYVNPAGAGDAEIKQALLQYGPLASSLCAGPEFQGYRVGVFNQDESAFCDRLGLQTNHAVLITGWDDLRGCWRIKNSWGTGWGQDGFGCVQYGVSRLGQDALYLVFRAAPGQTTLLLPGGGVVLKTLRPQFTWQAAGGRVDGYQVQLARDAAFRDLLVDTRLDGLAYTPGADLPAGALLYWRVRAWRGPVEEVLYGPWSAARTLKTLPAAPTPFQPVGVAARNLRPAFFWEGVSGQRYELQVARTSTCGKLLFSATAYNPGYKTTRNLPRGSTLYWRVRARGRYGPSPWSECVGFQTP